MVTALEKALAEAAKIAAQYGLEVDTESIVHADEIKQEKAKVRQANSNALEVIINQMHYKHATMLKRCVWCKQEFYTTYCYHQFCSDVCRVAEFKEHFKIDPAKLKPPASYWEYEEIGVVPTDLTKKLYGWAKYLISQFESLTDQEFEQLNEGPSEPDTFQFQTSTLQSQQTQQASSEKSDLPPAPTNLQNMLHSLESIEFDF